LDDRRHWRRKWIFFFEYAEVWNSIYVHHVSKQDQIYGREVVFRKLIFQFWPDDKCYIIRIRRGTDITLKFIVTWKWAHWNRNIVHKQNFVKIKESGEVVKGQENKVKLKLETQYPKKITREPSGPLKTGHKLSNNSKKFYNISQNFLKQS